MTPRAIVLGLLAAALVCASPTFNDHVLRQTWFIRNYMPVPIFAAFVVLLVAINPLLGRVRRGLALSGGEAAVVLALTLAIGFIPAHGLMHQLPRILMDPHYNVKTRPEWQAHGLMDLAPAYMLADPSADEDRALVAFIMGMSKGGGEHISPKEVPWGAWRRALSFWLPVVLLLNFSTLGLALVTHRQWYSHEHLPYPVARFARSLLESDRRGLPRICHDRLFWAGALAVFSIHAWNYASIWYPETMMPIRLGFALYPLRDLSETLMRGGGYAWQLFGPRIFFTLAALAFLLPKDVSFSVAIGPFILSVVGGLCATYGFQFDGKQPWSPGLEQFVSLGGFLGLGLMALYTGRRWYASTLVRSLGWRRGDPVEAQALWGMRIFLAGAAGFVAVMTVTGVPLLLALAYTALVYLTFFVCSRILAETGVIYFRTLFYPSVTLITFIGAQHIPREALFVMLLFGAVFMIHPAELSMPYLSQAFAITEGRVRSAGRVAGGAALAMVLGLAVATPVALYWHYDRGALALDPGWSAYSGVYAFEGMLSVARRLAAQGLPAEGTGFGFTPDRASLVAFFLALGVVTGLAWARLRFARWPLHPVAIVLGLCYQSASIYFSFFVGFLLKAATTRYGGASLVDRLRPLAFGVIAGDLTAGGAAILHGALYYWLTGEFPKPFSVTP